MIPPEHLANQPADADAGGDFPEDIVKQQGHAEVRDRGVEVRVTPDWRLGINARGSAYAWTPFSGFMGGDRRADRTEHPVRPF